VTPPEPPKGAVPVLNTIQPLVPEESAFALRIVMSPEEATAPPPLVTSTLPPTLLVDVVEPATTTMSLPSPCADTPTSTDTEPEAPDVAAPVATMMAPVAPVAELPVFTTTLPLVPAEETRPDAT
jgi:hypothetical protein